MPALDAPNDWQPSLKVPNFPPAVSGSRLLRVPVCSKNLDGRPNFIKPGNLELAEDLRELVQHVVIDRFRVRLIYSSGICSSGSTCQVALSICGKM